MRINTYDLDGVIFLGKDIEGLTPGLWDHIITGRSEEERPETEAFLHSKGIFNTLHMNPLPFDKKSRASSGIHKGNTIKRLESEGYIIGVHFEDDPIQMEEIKKIVPHVNVILLVHDLVEKENIRHNWEPK